MGALDLQQHETVPARINLWERACSRWGHVSRYQWRLTHRHREQARSHSLAARIKL